MCSAGLMNGKKITIPDILQKKREKKKITVLTAYSYPQGKLVDEAGIDMVLIGDTLGMVELGYDSTVSVSMAQMLHHARAVNNAVKRALKIGDMPYMSYQISEEKAVRNAGRFIQQAGCDAVKLEWFPKCVKTVKQIANAGIPVQGHIGLTPQTAVAIGGYKVQGKNAKTAQKLLDSAKKLQDAGVFSIVLECIPDELARIITESLRVPTIGIGAGPYCDGQVLVFHDAVGLFDRFTPKFVKKYANVWPIIQKGLKDYKKDVEEGKFPSKEHSFKTDPEIVGKLKRRKK
jgi:3-methyl-2-oxobutanoate hydroxymethyltransferase